MQREPKKILNIQLKRAGDILLATPVPELLKRHWPEATVHFLVDKAFASLLQHNPFIDGVRVFNRRHPWKTWAELRKEGYTHVFDFQSSPRSAMVALTSGAAYTTGYDVPFWGSVYKTRIRRPGGGLSVTAGKLTLLEPLLGEVTDIPERKIFLTPEEKAWAQTLRNPFKGRGIVGLIPTHRRDSRRWPADSFTALARQIEQTGRKVWLFWGPGEQAYVQDIQRKVPGTYMIPDTTWREMAALLQLCELVVTNDNGPMHSAVAVGVPTVTIYGPTDPRAWNPGGLRHRVVRLDGLSCLACNLNECPFGHECMNHLTPEHVFSTCMELLANQSQALPV